MNFKKFNMNNPQLKIFSKLYARMSDNAYKRVRKYDLEIIFILSMEMSETFFHSGKILAQF